MYKKELEKQEMLKNLIESVKELTEELENLKDIEELKRTVAGRSEEVGKGYLFLYRR